MSPDNGTDPPELVFDEVLSDLIAHAATRSSPPPTAPFKMIGDLAAPSSSDTPLRDDRVSSLGAAPPTSGSRNRAMTRLCYPTKTLRYDQDADGERPQSRDGKDAHNPDQTYRRPSRTLVDMPTSSEAGRTWLKVRNATQRQRNPREYDMGLRSSAWVVAEGMGRHY